MQDAAIHQAKQKALADAAASRKEIQDEVEQQEAIAAEAERRCQQVRGAVWHVPAHRAVPAQPPRHTRVQMRAC